MIAISSARPCLVVGGRVFTDLVNLITVHGTISTAARWTTLRTPNGTAGRGTTSGLTFKIEVGRPVGGSTSATRLAYGSTDVGIDSAGAPANLVYFGGASTNYLRTWGNETGHDRALAYNFNIPTSSTTVTQYPALQSDSADSMITCYGYET